MSNAVTQQSYPISQAMPISDGRLVLFCFLDGEREVTENIGRELFLFDRAGKIVWQVRPEPGATDTMTMKFDPAMNGQQWPMTYLYKRSGTFMIQRFNGDVFEVDLSTGAARHVFWTKS